nr:secretoglobin family 3A member 2 isoform X1 [Camelus bactrianus]
MCVCKSSCHTWCSKWNHWLGRFTRFSSLILNCRNTTRKPRLPVEHGGGSLEPQNASALVLGVLSPVSSASLVPVDKILPLLGPLKLLLKTLGISVEHLLEGLRKCVNELGPEAADSVKKLLEALSYLV